MSDWKSRQRGGKFKVSGFLALALLAIAALEGYALRHYMHEDHILRLLVLGLIYEQASPAPAQPGTTI